MTARVDDELWFATGDPTRRRVIDLLLSADGATATTISNDLPVTRQAVARHLGVLEEAGLVHATREGRERVYTVDETQMARACAQLAAVGEAWDARLDRIKRLAEQLQRERNTDR